MRWEYVHVQMQELLGTGIRIIHYVHGQEFISFFKSRHVSGGFIPNIEQHKVQSLLWSNNYGALAILTRNFHH